MRKNTPVPPSIVEEKIAALEVEEIGYASIREIVQLVSSIEAATGIKYIRMEMGIPGLPPSRVGVEAEIEINFDVTAGSTRVFKNGVQVGATLTQTTAPLAKTFTRDVAPHSAQMISFQAPQGMPLIRAR